MTSEHFKMPLNLRNDESESIASSNPLNVLSTEEKDEKNKKITNIKKISYKEHSKTCCLPWVIVYYVQFVIAI